MNMIEKRAEDYASVFSRSEQHFAEECYIQGATEQQRIDIENCVKWCEEFNRSGVMIGDFTRIDVDSFRAWITNMICPKGMWHNADALIDEYEKEMSKKDGLWKKF